MTFAVFVIAVNRIRFFYFHLKNDTRDEVIVCIPIICKIVSIVFFSSSSLSFSSHFICLQMRSAYHQLRHLLPIH